ncbi:hypothetical protein EGW08_019660 [Elysia chlorotica]|uniref:Uncharacterized protein n=1 Tax=Elysia chlorotica TaxID=188477 RepID=A0A433STI0_ELYCH|nr:hypothetical protein EGW08_019660 [Elysia chlorotica]
MEPRLRVFLCCVVMTFLCGRGTGTSSTTGTKFSLKTGVRVTSAANQIRQITRTVTQGNWTLLFRAQAGINEPVYLTYINTSVQHDNPVPLDFPTACLRMSDYGACDRHFRSHILDNFVGIDQVRLSLIKSDTEVAYVVFDAVGASFQAWFSPSRIVESTWMPDVPNESYHRPTLRGDCPSTTVCRRFYLFGPHTGCRSEWLYTMTLDSASDLCLDLTAEYAGLKLNYPMFFYSATSGRAALSINPSYPTAQTADVLALWVKYV